MLMVNLIAYIFIIFVRCYNDIWKNTVCDPDT